MWPACLVGHVQLMQQDQQQHQFSSVQSPEQEGAAVLSVALGGADRRDSVPGRVRRVIVGIGVFGQFACS